MLGPTGRARAAQACTGGPPPRRLLSLGPGAREGVGAAPPAPPPRVGANLYLFSVSPQDLSVSSPGAGAGPAQSRKSV